MYSDDRRQQPRVAAAYNLTFESFIHGIKVGEGNAYTINISENGAMVELSADVSKETNLILHISAPLYTLIAQGLVVHSHRGSNGLFQVGVLLTDVIEGNWEHLKRDITSRLVEI